MIDLYELEPFIPNQGKPIKEGIFTFTISVQKEDKNDNFSIKLKIKQQDTKAERLINFKLGIEKHSKTESFAHDPSKPHFQIEVYKRERVGLSATLYFTFEKVSEESLLNYAKATLVLIERIIEGFIEKYRLDESLLSKLVFREVVEEFGVYEEELLNALASCFKNNELIVRTKDEVVIVKTKHNLKKYLDVPELRPLYLPLNKRI
ncbi:hypothetical protein BVX95_01090 [archaeon D22]|nr:hypothetical protein BVX95_01090 [archaeon D22]